MVQEDVALSRAAVAHTADQDAWRETIDWALEQLSHDQREAFVLKHVEELNYEEMRELTGSSIPALKMRVLRAREALRGILVEAERG